MDRLFIIHSGKEFLRKNSFRGKKYLHWILDFLMPKLKDNMILKTRYGFRLKINPVYDKGIERNIFYTGSYEKGTLFCLEKIIKSGDIVLDIGANIGLTALRSAILTGSNGVVHAFEPHPKTFKLLRENININKKKNIIAYKIGLSNFVGKALIYDNININRGASSLYSKNGEIGNQINIQTLDRFVDINKISKIDFVKIDVEGSEVPALLGAKKILNTFKLPVICIEYSLKTISEYNPIRIYSILKEQYNYKLYKQKNGKDSFSRLIPIRDIHDLPEHDNIYCFQERHLKSLPKDLFIKY